MLAGTPLAFLGLLLLPLLAAVYLLVTKRRRLEVSAAFLFRDARRAAEGGRRVDRLQTPLLFLLELLAIAFLVLAAASLALRTRSSARPLALVLDDSYSMRAGGAASPRARGAKAVEEAIASEPPREIHVVLAGPRPRAAGTASTPSAARALLDAWTCGAAGSDLTEAIVLARQLAGARARLVVVTDRAAPKEGASAFEWWAFGAPRPNVAFVEATRAPATAGDGERLRLVVAAFGPGASETTLTVGEPPLATQRLALGAGERRVVDVALPASAGPVRARLSPGGALDVDDDVTLLPARRPRVRVDLQLPPGPLRDLLAHGLDSAGAALAAGEGIGVRSGFPTIGAELVVADHPVDAPWSVEIRTGKGAPTKEASPRAPGGAGGGAPRQHGVPFAGPFVLDTQHPLLDGVSLAGVVWGAPTKEAAATAATSPEPGRVVVSAGSVPLLVDRETAAGRRVVLALVPELSTLPRAPAWPALLWNLLDWRASFRAGPLHPNVAVGGLATVNAGAARDVTLRAPDGRTRHLTPDEGRVTFEAEAPGIHVVTAGDARWEIAANPLDTAESDLSTCGSGRSGADAPAGAEGPRTRDVAWLPALLALAALTAHRLVASRETAEAA